MQNETEYARKQVEKHKRKIILPNCISWEYGSNKFASQRGQSAFGTIRNTKINNGSDVQYWKKNDVVHYIYEKAPEKTNEAETSQKQLLENKVPDPHTSMPKFEAQHSANDNDEQYKAWIGGQTTTFTPAEAIHQP